MINPEHIKLSVRALVHYKKEALFQFLIIVVLGAVISSSLFTGYSVRKSLEKQTIIKLGKTDYLVSSGLRWFNLSLAERLRVEYGIEATAYAESEGWCRNFSTGEALQDINIYGIDNSFFSFHQSEVDAPSGNGVIVNRKLADRLKIETGSEIIITLKVSDPIPANAPFALPEESENTSVYKVVQIIDEVQSGNFSTGISQMVPMNLFVNIESLQMQSSSSLLANRLIVSDNEDSDKDYIKSALTKLLTLEDVGLNIRISERTGEAEIISSRIFIDTLQFSAIGDALPELKPVITYLANSIGTPAKSTPYSFVSGIDSQDLFPLPNSILISRWLADDIGAKHADTISMSWFRQEFNNQLKEESGLFIVSGIVEDDSKLSDKSLMPDFPGISGRSTCSEWEAGIPLLLDRIRDKDEEYWNKYGGTPKAFISYETGRKLWGNDFGSATALRFDSGVTPDSIRKALAGMLDPEKSGFTISRPSVENIKASNEGVDFSTLLLSLSIFIIVSAVILLALAVSIYFDNSKNRIATYHYLGFPAKLIRKILFTENIGIILLGAIAGAPAGYLVATGLVHLLNNVWRGAVQTDILSSEFGAAPVAVGIVATLLVASTVLYFHLRRFTGILLTGKSNTVKSLTRTGSSFMPFSLFALSVILLALSFFIQESRIILAFTSGALLFVSMILILRYYYLRLNSQREEQVLSSANYSGLYFSKNVKEAVTPALFIAAGLFAVLITGANKITPGDEMLLPSGGTGGYQLWIESAMPVSPDPASEEGIREFGLVEPELGSMAITGAYKLAGNDASCLNINHVAAPAILGVETHNIIANNEFSFSAVLKGIENDNPWLLLNRQTDNNTIYGIADQTVLQWGIKKGVGDTLKYRDERGDILNIIICGGLESSVFQGYLLIGSENYKKFYPSAGGKSVFLIHTDTSSVTEWKELFTVRMERFGISAEPALDRLISFTEVTNTYLEVFAMLGFLGLILGTLGLGFIILKNVNARLKEFSLMMAAGIPLKRIRSMLLKGQLFILFWGLISGVMPAMAATWPSIGSISGIPVLRIVLMTAILFVAGVASIELALSGLNEKRLMGNLKNK